ncbi:MAG: thiamine pyrophosphate-binding protein [Rhodopila sp.]
MCDPETLTEALKLLLAAERPVIIAGQGVLLAQAAPALQTFAELIGIPVVTSPNGKGAINEQHRLAFGCIGRNGTYAANDATKNADVILALGFTFDDRATSAWLDGCTLAIPPSRLIQIDIDPAELGRNYPTEFPILGCARASLAFMTGLIRALGPCSPSAARLAQLEHGRNVWHRYQNGLADADLVPLRPERLIRALSRAVPENAIVAADVGVHHNWIIQLFDAVRPRQVIHSWGFAAMGFATSGILGAKLAAPDRPCVAVVGDGSFLMTPHALATAVEYDIPVVWVVWNNQGYCSIRDIQQGMFGGRELATSFETMHGNKALYSPDFTALARSFGVGSQRVDRAGDLEDVLEAAIAANRPMLVEVPVDREIRPIGTGSWDLPPLPQPEPNFLKALAASGLSL